MKTSRTWQTYITTCSTRPHSWTKTTSPSTNFYPNNIPTSPNYNPPSKIPNNISIVSTNNTKDYVIESFITIDN